MLGATTVNQRVSQKVFAVNLRRHRLRRALTQAALGEVCGYAQGHISNLERGVLAPSLAVLERLANALGVTPAELLIAEEGEADIGAGVEGIAIINEGSRRNLPSPRMRDGVPAGDSGRVFCAPGLRGNEAFAAYAPDDAMAPEFSKGDLVVFSLSRKAIDGDACLVDTGKGEVLFRRALALPGGAWRLQPSNPRYEPVVIKARRGVRMWPAIGRWQMLIRRHRR